MPLWACCSTKSRSYCGSRRIRRATAKTLRPQCHAAGASCGILESLDTGICSRNDAIRNVGVLVAALGVFGTGTAWPDLAVAVLMAALAIWGASTVLRQAWGDCVPRGARTPAQQI